MAQVTLYTRVGCHLCDDAKVVLDAVRAVRPFDLDVVDIDTDPALVARYTTEVPVITIDGRKAFKYRLTAEALHARLDRIGTPEDAP
jgi:glutaredoxin